MNGLRSRAIEVGVLLRVLGCGGDTDTASRLFGVGSPVTESVRQNTGGVIMEPTLIWYKNPAVWAAVAAAVSAIAAGLSAWFAGVSQRKSAREMLDIVKADILILVSEKRTVGNYEKMFIPSPEGIHGIDKNEVRILLLKEYRKYKKKKWDRIMEAAFEELKMAKFEGF